MVRDKTFVFGHNEFPDMFGRSNDTFWIGLHRDAVALSEWRADTLILGGHCRALEELESVAKQLHAQIDRVVEEAREKLQRGEPSSTTGGFQTQVLVQPKRR